MGTLSRVFFLKACAVHSFYNILLFITNGHTHSNCLLLKPLRNWTTVVNCRGKTLVKSLHQSLIALVNSFALVYVIDKWLWINGIKSKRLNEISLIKCRHWSLSFRFEQHRQSAVKIFERSWSSPFTRSIPGDRFQWAFRSTKQMKYSQWDSFKTWVNGV